MSLFVKRRNSLTVLAALHGDATLLRSPVCNH